MSLRKFFISSCLALVTLVAVPKQASADWLFTPWVGLNWGTTIDFNGTLGDFEDELEKRTSFGASLAWMGAGAIGFELDFGYTPNFFESTEGDDNFDYGDSNLTTLMANVTVGIPIGGQSGLGIRPYANGGLGIIRNKLDEADDLFDVSSNDWGLNVGAGVTGFFTDNIGMRGDIRYFRALQDDESDDEIDVRLGAFDFWRGSVGVTFRF